MTRVVFDAQGLPVLPLPPDEAVACVERGRPIPGADDPDAAVDELFEPTIVTLEEFAAADEPGAGALVGSADSALIPEGSDVMLYGDGGAGKTTLAIDLACHLAAGRYWLGIPVARPVRALMIENEGPRALLRRKLRRKIEAWPGPPLGGRVSVLERPWGQFSFTSPTWRAALIRLVQDTGIEVVIAGPLTRIGMDTAGTLQQVAEFMALIAEVRDQCGRLLTVTLVHHENKGGAVSGAWEGSGDTLLHVQKAGNGHTTVSVEKARWASDLHGTSLRLAWTSGEGYARESDRDYHAETSQLLADGRWLTAKEIAAPKDEGGIGASEKVIREDVLKKSPQQFVSRTRDEARAVGRHSNSIVWSLRRLQESHDSDGEESGLLGVVAELSESESQIRDSDNDDGTPEDAKPSGSDSPTLTTPIEPDGDAERLLAEFRDLAAQDSS
jgi:hypothetical protein